MYNYKAGKNRILQTLKSNVGIQDVIKIPSENEAFNYPLGVKAHVAVLALNIVGFGELIKENDETKLAKIMKSFSDEVFNILSANDRVREIDVNGDSIYAVYSVSKKEELEKVLTDAVFLNTYQNMYQRILIENDLKPFKVGIGIGVSQTVLLKIPSNRKCALGNLWLGKSLSDALTLASEANRNGYKPIVCNASFYHNVKGFNANKENMYEKYFTPKKSEKLSENIYMTGMVDSVFNEWVNTGMKD